ncbi:host specificity factor TipJ family phage tail protein, partial [Bosea thiooxidans]
MSKATKAKADDTDNRPVYGVAGGGNQPRSGDRIPVIYGRCWNSPDLSQPDYTTYDGDDQVLYKRLTLGCGKYAVKAIRVSGVTMWTSDGGLTPPFTGAAIEVIPPGGASSLVPGSVVSVAAVANNQIPKAADFPNYAGPFDFGADAPLQTRIQLDYSLASGCYAIPDAGKFEGKQYPANWGVLFEYAPCDEDGTPTGAFSTLFTETEYVLSTRPIRRTRLVDVSPGRYTIRARNVGDPDTMPHPSGDFNAEVTNTVVWEGLRSHNAETIVRPGVTELAMRIRSGKQLGVTSYGDVEVFTSRILPVWYGGITGWVEEETDKAVWAAVDVLRDTDYGAAIPDSLLDLDRFKFYADNLTQYDRFSALIRGPVSVYEAASTVLGVMRASPLRLGSIWTLVRDEPKSVRKHVISRRQILTDSSGQTFNLDINDGSADVIVEWYVDGDSKRRREKRVTFGTQTLTPKRMSATG